MIELNVKAKKPDVVTPPFAVHVRPYNTYKCANGELVVIKRKQVGASYYMGDSLKYTSVINLPYQEGGHCPLADGWTLVILVPHDNPPLEEMWQHYQADEPIMYKGKHTPVPDWQAYPPKGTFGKAEFTLHYSYHHMQKKEW